MSYGGNDNQRDGGQGKYPRRPGLSVSAQSLSSLPRSPSEALEPSRGPEPPRRKRGRRKLSPVFAFINGVLTLMIIGAVAALGGIYFMKHQFTKRGPLDYSTVVNIKPGMGVNQIAYKLDEEGVISHWSIFLINWYVNKSPTLKAGEYAVPKGASVNEVLLQLRRGRGIFNKITIPEGLTSLQIVRRINNHPRLSGEITVIPEEGSLLPDTYTFSSNSDRQDIIRRMQVQQKKFVQKVWKKRSAGLPFKTPEEALILASIVEKETGQAGERDRVAGVFVNRLRKGMRLQSDPTIIYGLVGGKGTLGRPLFRSEIRSNTPYNTYVIKGLPRGPIANPGRAAIEAVMNPANTRDLYFVADGTGGHAFAPTLREHRENVKRWRVVERGIRKRQREAALAKVINSAVVAGHANDEGKVPGVNITKWKTESQRTTGSKKVSIPLPARRPQ